MADGTRYIENIYHFEHPDFERLNREAHALRIESERAAALTRSDGASASTRKRTTLPVSSLATVLGFNRFQTPAELQRDLEEGRVDGTGSASTRYGKELEPKALQWYSDLMRVEVKEAGFRRGRGRGPMQRICGVSDGLIDPIDAGAGPIGTGGGVEIKCRYGGTEPPTVYETIPDYYLPQVLAYLYLYDRDWWDFVSCVFDKDHNVIQARVLRVWWQPQGVKQWLAWQPTIASFIENVEWQ